VVIMQGYCSYKSWEGYSLKSWEGYSLNIGEIIEGFYHSYMLGERGHSIAIILIP
jgi:hypothetical protein